MQDVPEVSEDSILANGTQHSSTLNYECFVVVEHNAGRCSTLPSFQRSRTPRVADESSCQPGCGRQPAEEVDGTSIRQLLREGRPV